MHLIFVEKKNTSNIYMKQGKVPPISELTESSNILPGKNDSCFTDERSDTEVKGPTQGHRRKEVVRPGFEPRQSAVERS